MTAWGIRIKPFSVHTHGKRLFCIARHRTGLFTALDRTQNHIEYFAELSEAYFWTNDFYPFNKAELEAFDPQGYAAVEGAWQPLE